MLPHWQPHAHKYFVSIGSNISPESNTLHMLTELLEVSPNLHVSRIVQTSPMDVEKDADFFLNGVVCLYSDLRQKVVKERFNNIETKLGRDRTSVNRKKKSRPADIDILFALKGGETAVSPQHLPTEPYVRPMLIELLTALNIHCGEPIPTMNDGVKLNWHDHTLGVQPCTLTKGMFYD